jgi:hypothetical protein
MIFKNKVIKANRTNNEIKGDAAESQMAFYLRRYFGSSGDIHVINDACISIDKEYAQIDHLVITPFRIWLIESKSTSGRFVIDEQGQWVKHINDREYGMASPIQQAKLQAKILQGHFKKYNRRLNIFVPDVMIRIAVSADGIIQDGRECRSDVIKADLLCDQIVQIYERDAIEKKKSMYGVDSAISSELANYIINADEICRHARDGLKLSPDTKPLFLYQKVAKGILNFIEAQESDYEAAFYIKNNPHLWIHDPVFMDDIARDLSEYVSGVELIRYHESMCAIAAQENHTIHLNKFLEDRAKLIAEARDKVVLPKPTRERHRKTDL